MRKLIITKSERHSAMMAFRKHPSRRTEKQKDAIEKYWAEQDWLIKDGLAKEEKYAAAAN